MFKLIGRGRRRGRVPGEVQGGQGVDGAGSRNGGIERSFFHAGRPGPGMRVRVLVTGRVQGVFFRESTRREADRLGVSGWVRNLPDGRVEALFDGPPAAVDELMRWCHRGPDGALVEGVQMSPDEGIEGAGGSIGALAGDRAFRVLR